MIAIFNSYLDLLPAIAGFYGIGYLVSLWLKRNDIADVMWGLGFILIAAITFMLLENPGIKNYLIVGLVSLWGLRLSLHIGYRNSLKSEDRRYRQWREQWGKSFYWRSFLQIYALQAVLMLIIALPIIVINSHQQTDLSIFDYCLLILWAFGFIYETIADWQLLIFRQKPDNKDLFLTTGLRRYSRHPNYFGELVQWWCLGLFASLCPYGYVAILGPVLLTFLILKVSGIPLIEDHRKHNPDYQDYIKGTNRLLPW